MAGRLAGQARGLSVLSLCTDGAEIHRKLAVGALVELSHLFDDLPNSPGQRLTETAFIAKTLELVTPIVQRHLPGSQPVRLIAFDKTADRNWTLGWHQDRTICVKERHQIQGFGPWTLKQGLLHAEPPFEIIERMITVRVHLDDVPLNNAPLLIALGSHKMGKVCENEVVALAEKSRVKACLAEAGDVWIYSTPILHASNRSKAKMRRRVLQMDFSADQLPKPLEWALGSSRLA